MYAAINFFFIALVFTVHGLPTSHIIGGTDAPLGKYPHHVALKYEGSFRCGGSIINKRYILTAAHCVNFVTDAKKLKVHAGTIYLNETGDVYQAESVTWHTGFDDFRLNYDVGLIRLNKDIVFTNVVKPIRLAQKDIAVTDLPCVVSGWGTTSLGGPTPNTLQEIVLKVYSPEKCKLSSWRVTDNHVCTLTKTGEGVCHGDSGSALIAMDVQIGIASFVTPCALGEPDKFVKVSAYQDWIKEHMVDIEFNMHAFFALVVACLAVAAHGFPNTQIVGGKDAPPDKFPYQVSLRRYGSHSCGGSILSRNMILTAAHCIVGYESGPSLEALTIHAGTNLLSELGTVYKAKKVIVHEGFDPFALVNDIGLIILKNPIQFNKNIQPITLAIPEFPFTPAGKPCTLSGWGRTSLGGKVPDKLQEIELVVYDQNKCKQEHWRVQSTHICTLTKAGEGACHGDSGGPLVAEGVQIGIVSFGQPCARGSPDVFSRVASFQDWIQKHAVY
ncbi:PREDICTED: serine protease 48-like [Wasmannia auropunctata]|uniref:serine protease 48-like n=1 Tax=Wasmannia auropunctata TaxID=64793 RepID=UPI0005EFB070|nr:PREDICTED: serine protease 48-like [Wasmannia auropunctata]